MKNLFVLRHAKSDWQNPQLADHDRPLAPRGERAAIAMGRHLLWKGTLPDMILCSTARRAVETRALIVAQWTVDPPTEYDRSLYLTGRQGLVKRLTRVSDAHASVMVVGHNPDLQQLLLSFGSRSDPEIVARIERKFPAGALAVLDLPIDSWADFPSAAGRIVDLVTPKGLS